MRTLPRAILASAFAACAGGACRTLGDLSLTGPSRYLVTDVQVVELAPGASQVVSATMRGASGRLVPVADARWRVADSGLAAVVADTSAIPGAIEARARIVGRSVTGGATLVVVEAGGASDTVHVAVVPTRLDASLVSYAGTPRPDTIVRPALAGPPPEPGDTTVFAAPDTLVLSGRGALSFDTSSSYGYYSPIFARTPAGRADGYVVSRSPTQLKIVFTVPVAGRVAVRNLLLTTGDSVFGTLRIDSLLLDSVAVSRQRFSGTVAVVGDTMTVTAGPGTSFYTSQYYPYGSQAVLDTVALPAMSVSASQVRALSPVTYRGPVTVRDVERFRPDGSHFTLDSLKTNGSYAIAAATFPGTFATGGRLLDTVTVYAGGGATPGSAVAVPASYPCGGCSYNTWVVGSYGADSVRFLVPVGVNGPIQISGSVGLAALVMVSRAKLVVSGTVTGEANEPGNDSASGATPLTLGTYGFGALNGSTDTTDYYVFQVPANSNVSMYLWYPGTGAGDAANPHISAYVCDSIAGGVCANERDVLSGSVLVRAGTGWLRIVLRTPEPGYIAYRFYLGAYAAGP